MNLTKPVYIGRFDCIFCMDVLPQLSRSQRAALMERLHLYLEPGGYLFLSQTEKLCAPNLNFRSGNLRRVHHASQADGSKRGVRTVITRAQSTTRKPRGQGCVGLSASAGFHLTYANRNSLVRNSLIVSRSLAAFSNSNRLAASRMSLSSLPM